MSSNSITFGDGRRTPSPVGCPIDAATLRIILQPVPKRNSLSQRDFESYE
jgi:hypothetical protein